MSKIYHGDALAALKTLPDKCVNTCVTSPPYFALRDYGVTGQIGLEATPEEYIDRLVKVFSEVKRVLRDDGTLWLNIADSYAGSGKVAAKYPENALKYKQGTNRGMLGSPSVLRTKANDCKPKDLIGIPWRLAFALRDELGYYLRQDIIWAKPNPMPESVTDRCTKSHEYIFLLSKSKHYYFDAEAIAEPVTESTVKRLAQDVTHQTGSFRVPGKNGPIKAAMPHYEGKRNKRDVWTVTTKPFKGAHFATFPVDLITPCILAGCPRGGVVLDPFFGSGTVGLAAAENGRNYIGIDLNADYITLAKHRLEGKHVEKIDYEKMSDAEYEQLPAMQHCWRCSEGEAWRNKL